MLDLLYRKLIIEKRLFDYIVLLICGVAIFLFSFLIKTYYTMINSVVLAIGLILLTFLVGVGSSFHKIGKLINLPKFSIYSYLPITQDTYLFYLIKSIKQKPLPQNASTFQELNYNFQSFLRKVNLPLIAVTLLALSAIMFVIPVFPFMIIGTYALPVTLCVYYLVRVWYTNILFKTIYKHNIFLILNYIVLFHLIFLIVLPFVLRREQPKKR